MQRRAGESQAVNNHIYGARKVVGTSASLLIFAQEV
jgi:hypothetical protein